MEIQSQEEIKEDTDTKKKKYVIDDWSLTIPLYYSQFHYLQFTPDS